MTVAKTAAWKAFGTAVQLVAWWVVSTAERWVVLKAALMAGNSAARKVAYSVGTTAASWGYSRAVSWDSLTAAR